MLLAISFTTVAQSPNKVPKKKAKTQAAKPTPVAVTEPTAASVTHTTTDEIQWLTIEQAYKANQKQPRKWMIDLYTDWCGWCKVMDQQTFKDGKVKSIVGEKYYAVKYNPEKEGEFMLGKQSFRSMIQSVNGYPTTIFLDENTKMIQPLPGFQKADVFHQVLTYFGGNHYRSEPFDKFLADTYPKQYNR